MGCVVRVSSILKSVGFLKTHLLLELELYLLSRRRSSSTKRCRSPFTIHGFCFCRDIASSNSNCYTTIQLIGVAVGVGVARLSPVSLPCPLSLSVQLAYLPASHCYKVPSGKDCVGGCAQRQEGAVRIDSAPAPAVCVRHSPISVCPSPVRLCVWGEKGG